MNGKTSMATRVAGALFAAVVLTAGAASAVPGQMTVQGQLLNAAGEPVDGTYSVAFTLYDASDASAKVLWTETQSSVLVAKGLMDALLGTDLANPITPGTFSLNAQVWMGIRIVAGPGVTPGGEAELPRKPIVSVGFAFEAAHAASATAAQTAGSANTAKTADAALDLQCQVGCVSEAELAFTVATQGELDAAVLALEGKLPLSVDGLAGGTITSATTINGAFAATSMKQNGNEVCDKSGNCGVTLTSLTCPNNGAPLWSGTEWTCVAGAGAPTQPCTGQYQALQWDGANWKCITVTQTGLSQGNAKGYEQKDDWGYIWDGVERQLATWQEAKASCEGRKGRLPTATELWRVSGAQFSNVGNSYESNYLWALTPWSPGNKVIIRLTDGNITNDNDNASTKRPYRCVWPNNTAASFTGNHCYGPPGSECFATGNEGKRFNFDKFDRPSLPQFGAYFDCNFYHAHVPTELDYTEAIIQGTGLPNGSGNDIWTSDSARYDVAMVVRWTGTEPTTFNDVHSADSTWSDRSNANRFRCRGVGYEPGLNPNPIPTDISFGSAFSQTATYQTTHDKDLGAKTLHEAVTDCFARGMHVPHSRDWMENITAGLTNGSDLYVWTSDWSNYRYVQYTHWKAVNLNYTGYYSTYTSWQDVGTQTQPYRCTMYPLDANYAGPAGGKCNAGQIDCYAVDRGTGTTHLKVWADKFDRPAASYINAVKNCQGEGGHLANARQMFELIRDGLPNGNGDNYVWTSDAAGGESGDPNYVAVVKWGKNQANGVDKNVAIKYPDSMTYGTRASGSFGYRCVWTNELW